jgi:hypothetical protein
MQVKSATVPSTGAPATTRAVPAAAAAPRRPTRGARALQHWNRVALALLALVLIYMVGCLVLVQAPVDQPELPGLMAGFGVAPLLGLMFAYLVTRGELTRR